MTNFKGVRQARLVRADAVAGMFLATELMIKAGRLIGVLHPAGIFLAQGQDPFGQRSSPGRLTDFCAGGANALPGY